jgi:hypothetical protein
VEELHFPKLLQLFFGTYAFYHDRHSRQAVQQCIRIIFSRDRDPKVLSSFIDTLRTEANKTSIAPSNSFVLVEWFSILLQQCAGTEHWAKWGIEIILSDSQVLELCQSVSSKSNLRQSALVVTRRALRNVFSHIKTQQQSIEDIVSRLTEKSTKPASRNAIMLGIVAGVCSRQAELKKILETRKSDIYAFYTKEILGSRSLVPAHIANGLHDFFIGFSTNEDIETHLIPSLEKGLLRAPEIVLDDLLTPLFRSLPESIDLSDAYLAKLQKPLLSNVKSSNAVIRHGTIAAFKAAIAHCHKEESLAKISEEILNPLQSGKIAVADQRALYSEMLAAIPISEKLSGKLLPSIGAVAAKEASEIALSMETTVLVAHVTWHIAKDIGLDKTVFETFVKGISDKKIHIRRLWAIRLGEIFWSAKDSELKNSSFISLVESVLPSFIELWNETIANPVVAAQSGLVTAAFVFTAIALTKLETIHSGKIDASLKKADILQQALTFDPKPSFLLNHRIYTKLTTEDDITWLIRALFAVSRRLDGLDPEASVAIGWSQAVIFSICASNVTPTVRRKAIEALSHAYIQLPSVIADVITSGLWRWVQSVESGEKDGAVSAARVGTTQLHMVVKSICLPPIEASRFGAEISLSTREQQMISLLVISRPGLLPHVHWIDLCLRVEVDPGDLARKHTDILLEQILRLTNFNEAVRFSTLCHDKC